MFSLASQYPLLYKVNMRGMTRTVAAIEVLLISPGALFMTALFVRNLQPLQCEPARTAQQIVDWFAARPHLGLWGFLISLPFAVLVTGSMSVLRRWAEDVELRRAMRQLLAIVRAHVAVLLTATLTAAAGLILAIVAMHLLTD